MNLPFYRLCNSAGGHARPRRVFLFVLVLALAALVASSSVVHEQFIAGLDFTGRLMVEHPVPGAVVFVLMSALSAMLMFFSSVLLVPIGIQAWGEAGCFLLLWAGWALGGVTTYAIGRWFGRPMIERMLTREQIASYEGRVPQQESFWTALLVQLAFPSDVVGYFFGLLRYRRRVYFAALLCAEFPYAFGTVFLGSAFVERRYSLLLGGAMVAAGLLAWQWRMRRRG